MTNIIDPIIEKSNAMPGIRAGCAIVAFDGSHARLIGGSGPKVAPSSPDALPEPVRAQPPEVAAGPPDSEPIFNTSSVWGGRLNVFGKKALGVGASIAVVGGRHLTTALKQSSIGATLLGPPERYFLVDIGSKSGEFSFDADSGSAGIPFRITLTFSVRVIDAARVVELGVSDLVAYHMNTVSALIRSRAIDFRAEEFEAARSAFMALIRSGFRDEAVDVSGMSLRMTADERSQQFLRTASEEHLRTRAIGVEQRIGTAQRESVSEALSTPEKILAAWLATKDDRYRVIYEGRIAAAARNQDERMQLLRLALENKLIEPHDLHERFPDLAQTLLQDMAKLGGSAPQIGPVDRS